MGGGCCTTQARRRGMLSEQLVLESHRLSEEVEQLQISVDTAGRVTLAQQLLARSWAFAQFLSRRYAADQPSPPSQ